MNKTTSYTYDKANQLVSSTCDGKVTHYAYDAAGRLVEEGNKSYSYGWLDKVLSVTENGKETAVNGKPVEMTVFGETTDPNAFFTGKPMISELGYSFLFRDYDPAQGKWTTTDPIGYPDGWNNLAYCGNQIVYLIDLYGAKEVVVFVSGAGEGTLHNTGKNAMDAVYGSGNYVIFSWTQQSAVENYINTQTNIGDKILLIGHSYGGDTAENAAHNISERTIHTLITLDPVSFWDFSGDKPKSVTTWYNVIAEDDVYTWNDFIADIGGQWGEESGAINYVCPTDHNNPHGMLLFLREKGVLE